MLSCFKGKFKVTSCYGKRTLNGATAQHNGLDLVGLEDTNIYAPCDGVIGASTIVTDKSNRTWEWGNYVRLDTADGYSVYMCHMSQRFVKAGQKVSKGDKLGVMGNTGYSFGAHTHYEVRKTITNTVINPSTYTGIPNAIGIYEADINRTLAENCAILQRHGIMNTPQYWINTAAKVQYLDELIANIAEALE